MMHEMVNMDMNKIMSQPEEATIPGSPKKERKPYYQSITMPSEMFGGETPKVGSKHRFEMMGEIKEVRKTEQGIEIHSEIMQGRCMGEAAKATDEEFKDMTPDEREKYQKKEMEERGHGE